MGANTLPTDRPTRRRIIVACGGTGGHVFPGLAVARTLQRRGHHVTLWLAGKQADRPAWLNWDGPIVSIPARGLPSGTPWRATRNAAGLMITTLRCIYAMSRGDRADVILAMGSYASIGPGIAARVLGIPLVLHEANAVPGRAISFLARWAHTLALGFPEAADALPPVRTVVTGFPLREPETDTDDFSGSLPYPVGDRFTVLITGGSQGAHRLNQVATEALCRLHARGIPFQVIHLTGNSDADAVRDRYREAGVPAAVFAFLRRMDLAYAATHLAVCRAGAATCAELAAAGVPALLIPLPTAARDHQTANAVAVVRGGAADMIAQASLTADWLADYLAGHADDPQALAAMHSAALKRAITHAADATARVVEAAQRVSESRFSQTSSEGDN